MAVNLISLKCPECGAALNIEAGRKQCFCSYCGAKILIDNDHEYTYREIDEAEIKKAEVTREVELKRLELIEKHNVSVARRKRNRIILTIVISAIGFVLCLIGSIAGKASGDGNSSWYELWALGFFVIIGVVFAWILRSNNDSNEDDEIIDFSERVKIPKGVNNFDQKNYKAIEKVLRKAGFTDVTCIALNDLKLGLLKSAGTVASITVNGNEINSGGKKFPKDASIVITYHSFPG